LVFGILNEVKNAMGVSRAKRRIVIETPQKAPQPEIPSPKVSLRDAGMWGLLLLATLVVYLPALRGGLLWDDNMHVTRPELQSLHGLWRIWFDLGATQQYYPLLHSAFWLEHRLWGDSVLGYHLTNVALHAAAACMVVLLVRRLKLPGAWMAGFLFALNPGSRGLDLRTEEHSFRGLLPGRRARLFAL